MTTRFQLNLDSEDSALLTDLARQFKLNRTSVLRLLIRHAAGKLPIPRFPVVPSGSEKEAQPSPPFSARVAYAEPPPEPDVDLEPTVPGTVPPAPHTPRTRPNLPAPRDLSNVAQPPASFRVQMGRGRVGR
jgi:hypothetical protein